LGAEGLAARQATILVPQSWAGSVAISSLGLRLLEAMIGVKANNWQASEVSELAEKRWLPELSLDEILCGP
jgi:hypothetical protein